MTTTSAPSRNSIITVIGFLVIIFMASQLMVERYGLVDRRNVMLSRLIMFAFMINTGILIFMIISYNHVGGRPGAPGPKGIRGAPGPYGNAAIDTLCQASNFAPSGDNEQQVRTLGTLRTRQLKHEQ